MTCKTKKEEIKNELFQLFRLVDQPSIMRKDHISKRLYNDSFLDSSTDFDKHDLSKKFS